MTNNHIWNRRVLEKLRYLVLSGQDIDEHKWEYDLTNTLHEEDRAIVFLSTLKVIETSANEAWYEIDTEGKLIYKGEITISDNPDKWNREVSNFNSDAYEKLCHRFGLNPYENSYSAKLSLVSGVTPVIVVGDSKFKLRSMYEGKAAAIVRYCMQHANRDIGIDELRKNLKVSPIINIKETLKNGVFAHKTGVLSPFADVSPNSITLHSDKDISAVELHGIEVAAKSKKS